MAKVYTSNRYALYSLFIPIFCTRTLVTKNHNLFRITYKELIHKLVNKHYLLFSKIPVYIAYMTIILVMHIIILVIPQNPKTKTHIFDNH